MNPHEWVQISRAIFAKNPTTGPLSDQMKTVLMTFDGHVRLYDGLTATEKRSFHAPRKRDLIYTDEWGGILLTERGLKTLENES